MTLLVEGKLAAGQPPLACQMGSLLDCPGLPPAPPSNGQQAAA